MIKILWNFIKLERFKLQRRWMPWIILAILLIPSQMTIFINYIQYQNMKNDVTQSSMGIDYLGQSYEINCQEVLEGKVLSLPPEVPVQYLQMAEGFYQECEQENQQRQQQILQQHAVFTLPGSIPTALGEAQNLGIFLFVIFAASVFGTEYGWGTIRLVMAVGTRRWHYLSGKLAVLALAALGSLVLISLISVVTSLIVANLAGSVDFGFFGLGFFGDLLSDIGHSWFSLWPYIALATVFTVLTRSSAAGMASAIGYYFIEQLMVVQLLAFDWFQTVADYMLGQNMTAWMMGMSNYQGSIPVNEYPSQLHAALVLLVYTVVLGGLALWLFHRRDITATSTG